MKHSRKISTFCIILMMLFSLTGCATVVSIEYEDVEVTVTRAYTRGAWNEDYLAAGIVLTKTHDESYYIAVEYAEKTYSFTDAETYAKYSGKVGDTVTGVKEIRTYDDNTVMVDIVELK